jgi:hypothetical protein
MFGFLAWLAARRTERKIENLRVVPIQRVSQGRLSISQLIGGFVLMWVLIGLIRDLLGL